MASAGVYTTQIKIFCTGMHQPFALFIVSALFLSTLWLYRKSWKKAAQFPPGPRGFPVVGYLPFLRPNLHHQFTDLARRYGPIFKLQLGSQLCVVVNSPSLVKQIVRDQDADFGNRNPTVTSLIASYGGRDIAFAPMGTYWREVRKIFVREMLSSSNLKACHEHRRGEIRKTIRSLKTRAGQHINIGEMASLAEINVVTSMIMGSTLGADEEKREKVGEEFREVMGKFIALMGEPNISDFFPWLARFDLQGKQRKMKNLVKVAESILEPIINEGLKIVSEKSQVPTKDGESKDFLQILLELKDCEAGKSLDMDAIKAILHDIVIGGTDTTATMVEWVMAALLDNPDVMKKVQDELEEIAGMNNNVEELHLPKLTYLDAVVKETFRLYPPLPLLVPRCPSQTSQVGGYTIPKGTNVLLNMYAIHRDPQLWDNPFQFKPERFLHPSLGLDYTGNDYRFLPFGSGRRICAGIPLAEKMLLYILGSLLHSFNWHVPQGETLDLSDGFGLVIKKRIPLIAVPTLRLCNSELYH